MIMDPDQDHTDDAWFSPLTVRRVWVVSGYIIGDNCDPILLPSASP